MLLVNMRRGYSTKEFRGITDNIRKKLGEDVHLSVDLMVGFPGEDMAFENSIRFINDIGFGKMHIFNYSPREGTVAWPVRLRIESKAKAWKGTRNGYPSQELLFKMDRQRRRDPGRAKNQR